MTDDDDPSTAGRYAAPRCPRSAYPYLHTARCGEGGQWRELPGVAWGDAGTGWRIGLRQDHDVSVDPETVAAWRACRLRPGAISGARPGARTRKGHGAHARKTDRYGAAKLHGRSRSGVHHWYTGG